MSGLRKAVFAANSQIKFIAFTKTSPVKGLVILAQAQDKLTAMRWRQHLGHRLQVIMLLPTCPLLDLADVLCLLWRFVFVLCLFCVCWIWLTFCVFCYGRI